MANRERSAAYALVFASHLPHLQAVAREHGYALAVHGSMRTDLDLIAAPWTEEATDAETLIEALRSSVNGYIAQMEGEGWARNPEEKPCGRRAWSIYFADAAAGPYLDVSVMPRGK